MLIVTYTSYCSTVVSVNKERTVKPFVWHLYIFKSITLMLERTLSQEPLLTFNFHTLFTNIV